MGIMQRRHLSLDQMNGAVKALQRLTSSGEDFHTQCSSFSTAIVSIRESNVNNYCVVAGSPIFTMKDLDFLGLGELKTKMLLSSLTKLGKLQVEVSDGQIVGYIMS